MAGLLGVSVRKLRAMTPELPHVRHEGRVLYVVDALREWMNTAARKKWKG